MDLTGIFVALIGLFEGLQPVAIISIGLNFALGLAVASERKAAREAATTANDRFDKAQESSRAAIKEAHDQLASMVKEGSATNKDTAEIINQVAQTLATLADTFKGNKK